MTRTFTSGPARRERTPLMIAIVGASGSGKTLSALLLAEGIKRVQPGPIVVIDSEALRALKHANGDPDRFIHVPFEPPFGPLDYIEAFKHAIKHQPSTIIVDSMSHEWEGPGGVLAQHAKVVKEKGDKHKMTAWIEPKADHTAMKHFILQQRCNWIFCFRAKEKTGVDAANKPVDLGWQPLGADDLIYEMDLCALLYPGVDGRPRWRSQLLTEQAMMKLPGWFRDLFTGDPQLNPDIGERIARWAAGGDVAAPSAPPTITERFDACSTFAEWVALDAEAESQWRKATPEQQAKPSNAARRAALVAARDLARARVDPAAGQAGAPSAEEQAEILRAERAAAEGA